VAGGFGTHVPHRRPRKTTIAPPSTPILERKRQRDGRDATIISLDTPRLDPDGRRGGENRLRNLSIRLTGASMSPDDASVRIAAAPGHAT